VGSVTIAWKALQEGARVDWLPEPFVIELEGISLQGVKEQLQHTLPVFRDLPSLADSLTEAHDSQTHSGRDN